jgi:hypothetical protein
VGALVGCSLLCFCPCMMCSKRLVSQQPCISSQTPPLSFVSAADWFPLYSVFAVHVVLLAWGFPCQSQGRPRRPHMAPGPCDRQCVGNHVVRVAARGVCPCTPFRLVLSLSQSPSLLHRHSLCWVCTSIAQMLSAMAQVCRMLHMTVPDCCLHRRSRCTWVH